MNKLYPIKHWLTTLVIGPLLLILYEISRSSYRDAIGSLEIYPLFLMFGLLFSLPVFFVYYFTFRTLAKWTNSTLLIKAILNALVMTGVIITFQVIKGSSVITLTVAYSAAAVITSFLFKLRTNNSTANSMGLKK